MATEQKSRVTRVIRVIREQSTERLKIVSNSGKGKKKKPSFLDAVAYRLDNSSSVNSQKWKRENDSPFRYKFRPPPINW